MKIVAIAYIFAMLAALVGSAMAQQPQPAPTAQSTAEEANRAIAVLQAQRNKANDETAAARIIADKVQAELAATKKELTELNDAEIVRLRKELADIKMQKVIQAPTTEPAK